jgi:hypothetical protein
VSLHPAGQRTLVGFDQLLAVLRTDADRLVRTSNSQGSAAGAAWLSPEEEAKAVFAENKARLAGGWGG